MNEPDPRPPHPLAPLGAFLGCSLVWGSTFLVISIGNDAMPPMWAAAVRLAIATVILLLLCAVTRQTMPSAAGLRASAAFGFLNFGVSFVLLYWAEKRVASGLSAVIYATIPLSSALVARAYGMESLTRLKIAAASVAMLGCAVIFANQIGASAPALPLLGLLVAATSCALSSVVLKRGPRQSPLIVNAVAAITGLLVCLTSSFVAGEPHPLPRTFAQLAPILYLAIVGSVLAFLLMIWLINYWPVTRISFVSVIVPVVAMTLGTTVRHERFEPTSIIGSVLVVIGVMLRVWSERGSTAEH